METYIAGIHREGDRIMSAVAWFLFLLSLALASRYSTWSLALTLGLGMALASTAAAALLPARRTTRLSNAIIFMGFAALLIHQMHGMVEMHFSIFVLLAFLLFYRDWMPLVIAALVIAVHHLTFYYMQSQGMGVYVFPQDSGIGMVLVHAAFVIFETALLVYMAVRSRREALDAEQISALGSRIGADGTIDLRIVKGSAVGYLGQRIEEFVLSSGEAMSGTRNVAAAVHAASESLAQVTAQIKSSSEEASGQASAVSTSADEVSNNVTVVASRSEGMMASLRNIAENADEAVRVAKTAAGAARNTSLAMVKLDGSSSEVGKIIKVIASIAQQTNLLALNATIEAARAGAAGKGFAVVANEVKGLAQETARATQDIALKIGTIQSNTQAAVAAIAEIGEVVGKIAEISSTIATAVDGQTAITNEIGSNVGEAAKRTTEMAGNISRVAEAARNTSSAASDTQSASRQMADTASQLETLVGRFKMSKDSATRGVPARFASP